MALRRPARPGPKLAGPSFTVALPGKAPPSAQQPLKLEEPVLTRRAAERLIVDLDAGTVDSPFIAVEGQFPTTAALPSRSTSTSKDDFSMTGMTDSATAVSDISRTQSSASVATVVPTGPSVAPPPLKRQPSGTTNASKGASPTGGPAGLPPTAGGAGGSDATVRDAMCQRKFFRVDHSNLYVLVNGAASDEGVQGDAPWRSTGGGTSLVSDATIAYDELEIGEILGTGSQGTVRAVSHNGTPYALKRINVSQALSKHQADVERQARKKAIVRELQMLANPDKRHANLVGLYNGYFRKEDDEDSSEKGGNLHILMERMGMNIESLSTLVSNLPAPDVKRAAQRSFGSHYGGAARISNGSTLYTELPEEACEARNTPMPENVVSMIARDALLGLQHLHDTLRFVHMDIKPANLMLDPAAQVAKIADFGCAQQLPDNRSEGISVTNVNLGTKLYMSPERAAACFGTAGGTFNEKTDVWSLGISLLELAAGIHPCYMFREEYWDFAEHLYLQQMALPEQSSSLFFDFIEKCLAVNPADRYSAAQLLKHDFIIKYAQVPRKKLAQFVEQVRQVSARYERTKLQAAMARDLQVATKTKDHNPTKRNVRTWQGFQKPILGNVPQLDSTDMFPSL